MKSSSIRAGFLAGIRLSLLMAAIILPPSVRAACDLQIVSAGPCLADGTPGTPNAGDTYSLRVTFSVVGTPTSPFRIKFILASNTWFTANFTGAQAGYIYFGQFSQTGNLDDPIPWSITLDPDGVSGDTNLVNNIASGTFTPIPPSSAVELYAPRMMHGAVTSTLNFQAGSTIPNLWVLLGQPTSHGAQSVITASVPTNGHTVITAPYGAPLFEIARTNVPASTFNDTTSFTVQLNRIRVNPALLRTVTWADMNALTTNWTQWLAPDQMAESTNALVVSFVQQSLPANFRNTLTPYDTARTLHQAVMKKLTYQSPPPHGDAVNVLQDGVADCGGFAALLTACLRNVGIPARRISGFYQGDTQLHIRVEFHLPGVEWLVADPTYGNGADPTGSFAYYFGCVPNADSFIAMDICDAHVMPYNTFPCVQASGWWWYGGATFNSYSSVSSLQPNGVLFMTNSPKDSIQFYLSDPPNAGTVVIHTSTNLTSWTPVVTNSATGSVLNYSFPNTSGVHRFYRANVIP